MKYSKEELMEFVTEEDVKFIRLAFLDVFGRNKNISIMPGELARAFEYGIAIDASSIAGFGDESHSDLFLHPDTEGMAVLPWRPEHGRVVRLQTSITYPDGTPFECDTRSFLKKAVADAEKEGLKFQFGAEQEFYLFKLDEDGNPTKIPYDHAGYMDIGPYDRCENVRRDICLTLEQMGIRPESSHHEAGPGQNEIDFRYSDALTAAANANTFKVAVGQVALRHGLYADFSAKPLDNAPGNGFHINMSVKSADGKDKTNQMIAGVLAKARDMAAFTNPFGDSYKRLGNNKAPAYISWSAENRSQLVRIPAAQGEFRRAEYRAADPSANPYLAIGLMIYAGLYGIKNDLELPPSADINLFTADFDTLKNFERLPASLDEARRIASHSDFIKDHVPAKILDIYCSTNR